MKCKTCGTELPEGTVVCPHCNTVTEQTLNNPDTAQQNDSGVAGKPPEQHASVNPFLGKKYHFCSSRGTNLTGFSGYVESKLEVGEDRLYINIRPKKYSRASAILFKDMTGIEFSFTLNFYYIFWISVSFIACCFGQFYCLLFIVAFIWLGSNQKIRVHQRNGIDVVMYCQKRSQAEEFKNDMQQLMKILAGNTNTVLSTAQPVQGIQADQDTKKERGKMLENNEKIMESTDESLNNSGKEVTMTRFCKYCGRPLNNGEICHCRDESVAEVKNEKAVEKEAEKITMPKAIGIVNIVAGSIMLLLGVVDIDYDWGLIALIGGAGLLVTGILELLKKNTGIIQLIFGAVSILVGLICDLEFDWGYIGILIGAALFIPGLLRILKRTIKPIAILEIVFGGVLLLFAFADMEYDWGITAFAASVGFLVSGILYLVFNRKNA